MLGTNGYLSGRYRLENLIAVGGMGEVWQGTDTVLVRPVAVKLLNQADSREYTDAIGRFRAEARHVGSLSHPGIAQVFDFCEAQPGYPPCLVMELVEGPSLASTLSTGPLDAVKTMDIVAQTAQALQAAHAAGLVHRDIKPSNLLLAPGGQVKIIDFGIAQTADSATVTGTGTVMGSPAYLAPERAKGGAATPASDLYSLGIVAYECLVGAPPFAGSAVQIAHAHVSEPVPQLPVRVPAEVAALVEQLMAKEPALRPANADEVAQRARELSSRLQRSGTQQFPSAWNATADHHQTLLDVGMPPAPDNVSLAGRRRAWPGLLVGFVVLGLVAIAGLIGWQLKGAVDNTHGHHSAHRPPAGSASANPSTNLVTVAAASLVGQREGAVRRQLQEMGLRPRVIWQRFDQQQQQPPQPPGTVLSVQPSGPLPYGSVVVITAVGGHGNGNPGDNGGGGGGGN